MSPTTGITSRCIRSWSRPPASQGLAGATVLRGIEGFGASSRIHTSRILSLSEACRWSSRSLIPPTRSEAFLASVDQLLTEGLVTMERVEVRAYRARPADQ